MATLRLFSLRSLTRSSSTAGRRYIKSTCHRVQKAEEMDELQKNPYYAKYAGKIASLQKTSPEEFLERLSVVEEKHKEKSNENSNEKDFSMPTKPKDAVKLGSPSMMRDKVSCKDRIYFASYVSKSVLVYVQGQGKGQKDQIEPQIGLFSSVIVLFKNCNSGSLFCRS